MRVFVTGATGHIGSAVVRELLAHGHSVAGLARSDGAADKLRAMGAAVVRGDLDALDTLRAAARESEGVIDLAFDHGVAFGGTSNGYSVAATQALRAITTLGEALSESGKPLVTTAGTAALAGLGRAATERDTRTSGPRVDGENTTIAFAQRGVRAAVVRLAPTVHSELDRMGFVPMLVAQARRDGFAAYVGEGANRWPAVHTLDAARLYRLALESAPAGARLHGAAEQGVAFRAIAEAIAAGLGVEARSVRGDEAPKYLGFLAGFAQLDNPTDSANTRAWLQWQPREPALLQDIALGHYFVERASP